MGEKTASCLDGFVTRRNARMSVATPMDMGIDPGVLAAEVAKFLDAQEERKKIQAPRRPIEGTEEEGSTMRKRNARIGVARPVDLGIDTDWLAAEVAAFRAATERRPCKGEDGPKMMRGARINVAMPVDLGIDPNWLAAEMAEFRTATERRQASRRDKRATRQADAAGRSGRRRHAKVVVCS